MKSKQLIIIICLILLNNLAFSQSNTIVVKTQLMLKDINCNDADNKVRKIDIQLLVNGNYINVKNLESTKCFETFIVPKNIGKYKAFINVENYIESQIDFEILETSVSLTLKTELDKNPNAKILEEVVVKSVYNNPIKVEGNKTSYSVKNNDALNNGTALETIQKLPGVFTDINGNITLNGKTSTIYIDGLPTNMGGQDLTNYLNSIASSTVSKVEIINNPGASFDANTSSDVINVVTNQKTKKDISGTLYSSANVHIKQKYQTTLSLNGLYKKVNWNFNTSYSDIDSENGNDRIITDILNNAKVKDNSFSDVNYKPFTLKTGIGFPITANDNFDIRYSLSNVNQKTNASSYFLSDDNFNIIEQNSVGNQKTNSSRNELTTNYTHKFKNPEKLFSINYQFYNFNRKLNSVNSSDLGAVEYINSSLNAFKSNTNKIKGDLTLPLSFFKLNTGFKIGNSDISSNGTYFNNISNNENGINFEYKDLTTAVYAELFKKYSNYDFTFGLRYEYINITNKTNTIKNPEKNFSNVFPSFNIGYHIDNMTALNLSYSRKVKLPGYQELDPNISGLSNNLVTDGGNPLLNPSFSHNLDLKFSFLSAGYVSLTYSNSNIDNYAVIVKENGKYKQTIEQFENIENYGASFGMPFPLGIITQGMAYTKKITDISKIDYVYLFSGINYPKYINENYQNNFKGLYYLGASSQFILPFESKLGVNYIYTSTGNYTIYNLDKPFYRFDLTLTKVLFKKTTKIQFSFSDILKTATGINGSLSNSNNILNLKTYNDSQRIKFSLTYNFGSSKDQNKALKEEIDERENKKSSLDIKL